MNKTRYNLVCQTLQFLDCICGSTTGGLGLLGLYINESNVGLINQALATLTEYCQGPCHENQVSYHRTLKEVSDDDFRINHKNFSSNLTWRTYEKFFGCQKIFYWALTNIFPFQLYVSIMYFKQGE